MGSGMANLPGDKLMPPELVEALSTLLADALVAVVQAATDDQIVMIDPNCRPSVDRLPLLRASLDAVIGRADVVKVSGDDLEYLFPGVSPLPAAMTLAAESDSLVLFTDGANAVHVITSGRHQPAVDVVLDVLVAVGHHGSALVPPTAADDVDGVGGERVGGAHDRPDVHVVLPVLDRDVERMPVLVEIGDDRLHPPVAVAVDHVAGVALAQQLRVEVVPLRPVTRPGADAVRGELVRRSRMIHPASVAAPGAGGRTVTRCPRGHASR